MRERQASGTSIRSCSSSSSFAKAASGSDFCSCSNSFRALRLLLFFSTRWYLQHEGAGSETSCCEHPASSLGSCAGSTASRQHLSWMLGLPPPFIRPHAPGPGPLPAPQAWHRQESYFLLLIFFSRRALAS